METAGEPRKWDVSEASLARLQESLRELIEQRKLLDRAIAMQEGGIQLMQMLLAGQAQTSDV